MNALAQAIANGGDEIYFPPGTYKIKSNATMLIPPVYKTGAIDGVNVTEILALTGTSTTTSRSSLYVMGTLSAGVATITFYNIFTNDQFLVLPLNQSTDVQGVLYISSVNQTTQQITIRSTLATDTRSFIVLKLFAGG
jgi:hypothetical protein